jgi:hypothetical protein
MEKVRLRTTSVTGFRYTARMSKTAALPLTTAIEAPRHRFFVGMDAQGRWIVRDDRGLVGGIFADRESALRFASLEGDVDGADVTVLPETETLAVVGDMPERVAPFRRTADALLI